MVEVLPVVNTILRGIQFLGAAGNESLRLDAEIMGSLESLQKELRECGIENYEQLTLPMQELFYDIEDFICCLSVSEKSAAFFRSLTGKDSRPADIARIKIFREDIERIRKRQDPGSGSYGQSGGAKQAGSSSSAAYPPPCYAPEEDLVGLDSTKEDLMELLLAPSGAGKPRVIAVVGCIGLGKTALARAVYEATIVFQSPPGSPAGEEAHEADAVTIQSRPPAVAGEIHEAGRPEPDETRRVRPWDFTWSFRLPARWFVQTIHQASPEPISALATMPAGAHEARKIHGDDAVQSPPPTRDANDDDSTVAFNCKIWVVASACENVEDFVSKVLNEVDPGTTGAGGASAEALLVQKFLLDKRYLVIIDDMQPNGVQWEKIKHVFPENDNGSRIIVTTSVHSIARYCSSGSYYVYQMQCLGKDDSKVLFWKKLYGCSDRSPSDPEGDRAETILAKCGWLPLAVISAAKYLREKEYLSIYRYEEVCRGLGNLLESDDAFGEMKEAFAQCYDSLPNYDHKNCLLYCSIFPRGHQINSKSLARRLKAEELVAGDVLQCLENLIDKSMIEPATIRKNPIAKRCQVQGMMLEYTIHKSLSRNLVTVIHEDNIKQNWGKKSPWKVRRLSIQANSNTEEGSNPVPLEIVLSTVRSLTIFKSSPETRVDAVDFRSCKMMRVLDLEGCKGLSKSKVVNDICELLFLKYLSLRNTDVDELPTKMESLEHLETLDIRQTRVAILPVEVIVLPELACLLGEFEIPPLAGRRKAEVTAFLKNKSKLHTLAGIVINKSQGFKVVIVHARKLKKVKIYTAPATPLTPAPTPNNRGLPFGACFGFSVVPDRKHLPAHKEQRSSKTKLVSSNGLAPSELGVNLPPQSVNQGVVDKGLVGDLVSSLQKRFTALESISIVSSGGISGAFVASLRAPCAISSIKLWGALTNLPRTLEDLRNLNKLHLFSTGLSSEHLADALQSLNRLEYLKLAEGSTGSWEGVFHVRPRGFSALQELCFEAPKQPRVKIERGMAHLTSLQLLCPHPPSLTGVEGIEHLKYLNEVILHHSADDAKMQAWKVAAKGHGNSPCVKKQPIINTS